MKHTANMCLVLAVIGSRLTTLNAADHRSYIQAPPEARDAGTAPAGRLMTAAELERFASGYYAHPRPERVGDAIESLGPSGLMKESGRVFLGFFAEIFAANPQRMAEWQALIDRQDNPTRKLLGESLESSRPVVILASAEHSGRLNDICWGAFFASGNPAYLQKLVDQLKFIDERQDAVVFWGGGTAMWSLARNASEHPAVHQALEAAKAGADPRTREIIDDLLINDPSAIKQQITELRSSRKFSDPLRNAESFNENPHTGLVGPSAGDPRYNGK